MAGCASLCLGGSALRAQDDDYRADSRAWNGLSALVALAHEVGADLQIGANIDLATLRPADAVLLIYPSAPPPRADLSAFMVEGGRLAVADDFGEAGSLLAGFGILRGAPGEVSERGRLRGNRNVLLARPAQPHPLAQGVHALVVNHPRVLSHAELAPIFALDDAAHSAVALTGAVGKGRLVALADPSALINNMLELRDNRVFARNLLRYLARDGRVLLAVGAVTWTGRYPSLRRADPLASIRDAITRLAEVSLPPFAVQLSTAVMAVVLLAAAASMLPRRDQYLRAVSLPRVRTLAGLAGRLRHFADGRRDLAGPALAYKQGFERSLIDALGLRGSVGLHDIESALSLAGLRRELREETARFVAELQRLELELGRTDSRPALGPPKLHALVAQGDRILAALPSRRASGLGT